MKIELEIGGEVAERTELLNGTETVSLEGRSADGRWALSGMVTWNIGLEPNAGEGDLTLARVDGAELFGTLIEAVVTEVAASDAESAGGLSMQLEYVIDGGDGAFESASGACRATLTLAAATFAGQWSVELETT